MLNKFSFPYIFRIDFFADHIMVKLINRGLITKLKFLKLPATYSQQQDLLQTFIRNILIPEIYDMII